METIGLYKQLTPWTNQSAGTAEWCKAKKDGQFYFIKRFLSPVYPSQELGLSEKKYQARVTRFHSVEASKKALYQLLKENNLSGALIVPIEIINYQYHLCTVAPYMNGNITPDQVCLLSEWQRLILMRTLTLALINVHRAGIIHCDIKPENVLIYQNPANGSCSLKLIDFDGSCLASSPPNDLFGDPVYYAPEVCAMSTRPDLHLDQKIDIFALGLIFHYFWSGKLPKNDTKLSLGQFVLEGNKPVLDSLIPEALKNIIEQALDADPAKRINAETIYTELEKILPEYPVKILNLQKETETGIIPIARETGPNITGIYEKPKHYLAIHVFHCKSNGKPITTETIEIAFGEKKIVHSKEIPGYHLKSDKSAIEVSVDEDGYATEEYISFIYENDKKKERHKRIIKWIVIFLILDFIISFVVRYITLRTGNTSFWFGFLSYNPLYWLVQIVYAIYDHLRY